MVLGLGVPRRLAVPLVLVLGLGAAGCGGGAHPQTSSVSQPRPAPKPAARLHPLEVAVVDGDTGRVVPNAVVHVRGALRRHGRLLVRGRPHALVVSGTAPGYAARTLEVTPRAWRVSVTLYRPAGQWLMYGAAPARTQFQPAIKIRPPVPDRLGPLISGRCSSSPRWSTRASRTCRTSTASCLPSR